jgi:archaellum component FlaF (FlaF/FlaG flagellin family)
LDKVIVTALLVAAGVVSAVFVFNTVFPMVTQSSDAMGSMERRIDQRMKSQVEIIQATKTPSDTIQVWVKNIGDARISPPESSDVFFGPEGNFSRIPYNTGSVNWSYVIVNDTAWNPRATLQMTISGYTPLTAGTRYFVKIALLTGIASDYYFSW